MICLECGDEYWNSPKILCPKCIAALPKCCPAVWLLSDKTYNCSIDEGHEGPHEATPEVKWLDPTNTALYGMPRTMSSQLAAEDLYGKIRKNWGKEAVPFKLEELPLPLHNSDFEWTPKKLKNLPMFTLRPVQQTFKNEHVTIHFPDGSTLECRVDVTLTGEDRLIFTVEELSPQMQMALAQYEQETEPFIVGGEDDKGSNL